MGKDKLRKFAELATFDNVLEPSFDEVFKKDHRVKGTWHREIFKNDNPIVLELGCGKGEYAVNMARKFPDKNFIGIDIKGNRMWRGAKTAVDNNIRNIFFLRTRIEFVNSFFVKNEVDEIWITFPDPQLKDRRSKKRLTSSIFLGYYQQFLKQNGIVNLKTDNTPLYRYTNQLLEENRIETIVATDNLYNTENIGVDPDILSIKTHYEKIYLQRGMSINFIRFMLDDTKTLVEPPDDEE